MLKSLIVLAFVTFTVSVKPTKECLKPHEVYVDCAPSCGSQNCEDIDKIYHCPRMHNDPKNCHGACICESGYYRNKIGECISEENCRKCRGLHEYFSCGGACDNVCKTLSTQNQTNCHIYTFACVPKCYCEEGYARDDNDICIPIADCKAPDCGENEVCSDCINGGCQPKRCSELGLPTTLCPKIHLSDCIKGCLCKDGYYRNNRDICVPKEECDSCGGDHNAVPGCGVNCGRHCSDIGKEPMACPAICYSNRCDCKPGFLLNDKGKCVNRKDCTPTCGKNEEWSKCVNGGCGPKTCDQLGNKIGCVKMDQKYCKEGCTCKDEYLRDENGKCIHKSNCPECGGDPNAVSGCGINCGRHCSDIGKESVKCLKICINDACDCRHGFLYNDITGKCVRPEECNEQCPDDEIYEKCPDNLCTPQKCSQLGFPLNCTTGSESHCRGKPRCVCKNGNVRDSEGKCIPIDQCPSCGGDPNAVSGCSNYCGKRCSDYNKTNIACALYCLVNGCQCRDGFIYDDNLKKCVRPKHCTTQCGVNEVYDTCANGGCRRWNCSDAILCIDPIKCKAGCSCREGYSRAPNGNCIPEEQCSDEQCPDDEIYEKCPDNPCTPQKCSQLGFPLNCMTGSESHCRGKPRCVCKNGNVRDSEGKCIPIDQCPSCGGDPNAVSGCSNYCGKRCSDYNKTNIACALYCLVNGCQCRDGFIYDDNLKKCVRPKHCTTQCGVNEVYDTCANGGCRRWNCSDAILCIDPIKCKAGCSCREGYSRAPNGNCIPEEQCSDEQCPDDEIYEKCPDNLCTPQKCSQLGFPLNCMTGSESHCRGKPRCVCKNGNVRDSEGKCIPIDQCPSCGGDPNAVSGCSNYCGKRCSDYNKTNIACALYCLVNGCQCRDGFIYDDNLKKCVRPKHCTTQCGVNEVYDTCANGGCRRWNCSDAILCIDPIKCKPGCSCREGYSRAPNGNCIPEEQCSDEQCPDDEIYEKCPDNLCTPQKCSQLGFPLNCMTGSESHCRGKPRCVCKNGNVRDSEGKCIPIDQCPSCGGDPNAVSGCSNYCGKRCSDYNKTNIACALYCLVNGCQCRDGFIYDDNLKKCVRPKHCTSQCGVNEVYDTCANGGCRRWNCSDVILCIDPIKCKAGCSCREGYSRAPNGNCIPEEQCSGRICGLNERYEEKPSFVCEPLECSEVGFPLDCPPVEDTNCIDEPACICKDNYVRNRFGECVQMSQCPSCGGDPNAIAGCGVNCGKTCSTYGKDVACVEICYVNGCDCRDGFVYDEVIKKCVRYENCSINTSKCTKPNEEYDPCAPDCPPQNCRSIGKRYSCPAKLVHGNAHCTGACRCKKGYYRNDDGECVTKEECGRICGPNERYEEKPSFICEPLDCSEVGFQLDCPPVKNTNCRDEPACICKHSYVRNQFGECVPRSQCPSCGGDPNAVASCGVNCSKTWSTYGKDVACEKTCYDNSCDCKDGFVYDEVIKKCIKYENCSNNTSEPADSYTEAKQRLDKGSIALCGEFIYQLSQSRPDENSVMSCTSIMVPLAQIAIYAQKLVLKQLLTVLNLRSIDEIKNVYLEDTASYENKEQVLFELATKYYFSQEYTLSKNFIRDSKKYFNADGENVDFRESEEAAETINQWVSDKTHERIQDIVKPETLNENTVTVLVNVVYFLGNWIHQFNPNNTQKRNFTKRNNDVVKLDTMYQENTFKYAEISRQNLNLQALEMPYKGDSFSFLVILPEIGSFDDTVSALRNPDFFIEIITSLKQEKVQVYLPKIKINTELDLAEMFEKDNVTAMFDPASDGFKGILEKDQPLYVSSAIHKAFIEVDETGTEAAAATAVTITTRAAIVRAHKLFDANHPFFFYVSKENKPMFCGAFVGPD